MKDVYKAERESFDSERAKIDLSDENGIQERLYKMIDYSVSRHDWYDSQKHRLMRMAVNIIGISTVGASICLALYKLDFFTQTTEAFSWITVILFFFTGMIALIVYAWGMEQNHPYRQLVDIRSWFFKYTIEVKLAEKLSKETYIGRRQVKDIIILFQEFKDRWLEYTSEPNRFIKEDLEQVFILQVLQKYRTQEIKRIRNIIVYGLIISCISLAITVVLFRLSFPTT